MRVYAKTFKLELSMGTRVPYPRVIAIPVGMGNGFLSSKPVPGYPRVIDWRVPG